MKIVKNRKIEGAKLGISAHTDIFSYNDPEGIRLLWNLGPMRLPEADTTNAIVALYRGKAIILASSDVYSMVNMTKDSMPVYLVEP